MTHEKIERVRVHSLRCEFPERFGWSLGWTRERKVTLVEVITTSGIHGWGEGTPGPAPELALGKSLFEIAAIWEDSREPMVRQRRRGPACGSGLDIALWDALGRALGKPVCELLGKVHRTRVEAYCTALYRKDWPDLAQGLAEEALGWKQRGYRHIKMKIGFDPETDVRIVAAVRQAIGSIALGVDSNCAYDAGTAVALARRLEQFDLMWWEEPLLADDLAGYDRLRAMTPIPIAAGETETADWLIANYIQPRRIDILQPDLEWVGLTGFRQIAHSCWLNHLRLVPHNWGTALRTAATLHAMATCPPLTEALTPPAILFEFDRTESPFRDAVVTQKLEIDASDACIAVPMGPGLGVDVIPEAVSEFRVALRDIPAA
ncbi:MAG: mandelate racemase/muconate lactonizing enzyme family protein [Bryobacteraceae bacterium]